MTVQRNQIFGLWKILVIVILMAAIGNISAVGILPPEPGSVDAAYIRSSASDGGHAVTCHVGKDVSGLIRRITQTSTHQGPDCMPAAGASSSFFTMGDIVSSVKDLIRTQKREIRTWAATAANGTTQAFHGTHSRNIGVVVSKYEGRTGKNRSPCIAGSRTDSRFECRKTKKFTVVFRSTGSGNGFILTAYPK